MQLLNLGRAKPGQLLKALNPDSSKRPLRRTGQFRKITVLLIVSLNIHAETSSP
jgi:hypothetical protein